MRDTLSALRQPASGNLTSRKPCVGNHVGHLTKKESDENLAELIEKFSKGNPYQVAEVYAFRGETDLAFQWLARAYTEPDSALREIKSEPLLNNLRRDPRYAALLKKMGLPL